MGVSVILHGNDIWTSRRRIELRLLKRNRVRVIAVSAYSAGAASRFANAAVLPPGLDRLWFETLLAAGGRAVDSRVDLEVATAFRLTQWRDKGLPEIVDALGSLTSSFNLKVYGSGPVPEDLQELVAQHDFVSLIPNLPDEALADGLASADVFVLATRTRQGDNATGEGFGLVLLEAQVAGTLAIAPAFGGSHDAILGGLAGFSPIDESPDALADVLKCIAKDSDLRRRLASEGRELAVRRFAPDRYARLAVERLL